MKKQKRAGRVFLLAAVLLGVLELVLYIAAGRTRFCPN